MITSIVNNVWMGKMVPKDSRGRIKIAMLTAILVVIALSGCAEKTAEKTAEKESVKFYTIATATPGGTYYPVGVGLATLWTEKLKDKNIRISAQYAQKWRSRACNFTRFNRFHGLEW